jgi:PmbA protein
VTGGGASRFGVELLEVAQRAVLAAMKAGADEAEAYASRSRSTSLAFQKNDLKGASTDDETTVGIRIFVKKSMGFATANRMEQVPAIAAEAVALARVSPPDPMKGLPEAQILEPWPLAPDPALEGCDLARAADLASAFLDRACSKDKRISVDSGGLSIDRITRAIASNRGVSAVESHTTGAGSLFGMAVDGSTVGSFDADGDAVRSAAELPVALAAAADRFVVKTLAALHAGKGESFKGTVILSPEVVSEFLVDNLLAVLSAKSVRTGKSPLKDKIGKAIAAPAFTLVDDACDPGRASTVGFDREGMPSVRRVLVDQGVLQTFLYDSYEARVAGLAPRGNARGGASGAPSIGAVSPTVPAGTTSFAALCSEPKRAVLVSRFSGSSNPITGEFSGVVKGGFLLRKGERTPIREVQISGNLYDALKAISGVSLETRLIDGSVHVPAIRIEDVSVTAG